MAPYSGVTITVIVLLPTASETGDVADVPFTVMVELGSVALGVTVIELTLLATDVV